MVVIIVKCHKDIVRICTAQLQSLLNEKYWPCLEKRGAGTETQHPDPAEMGSSSVSVFRVT